MTDQQATLTGEVADSDRKRPATWLKCEECGEALLRSSRFDHEHDLGGLMAYEKAMVQELDEKIPDHAKRETQQWEVTFHYTCIEQVVVEASDKHDAKRAAELHRDYDGEVQETVHTERRALGDPSPASIEWLEYHNLLPEDHGVTGEDLTRVMDSADDVEGVRGYP